VKVLLLNIILLIPFIVGSQTGLFIDGATFNVKDSTLIYVEGDVEIMLAGAIEDSGVIELTQHWTNNSGSVGLINNAPGIVRMIGANQRLQGTDSTTFYNLELRGFGIKEAFQNQTINNTLDLGTQELQVHDNIVHVTNTDPSSSLVWLPGGFVSGDVIGGYFARSTSFSARYDFPVGNNNITNTSSLLRAVSLTPSNADSNVYGVRLAYEDASLDASGTSFTGAFGPYNRSQREDFIVQVNPSFYHNIVRMQGTTPAYASIYFYENDHIDEDRRLDGLANWEKNDFEWKLQTSTLDADLTSSPSGFLNPDHAMRWTMDNQRDDPHALTVMEGIQVFVPQIFSPNQDGFNDILYVRGRKISEVTFIIYNRWGEKVFETTDKNIGWNGKHRGKDAQASIYVYYVDAIVEDVGRVTQKGNITLVR